MKSSQKIVLVLLAWCVALLCMCVLACVRPANAAEPSSTKRLVIVPAVEDSRFVLSHAIKLEDKDGNITWLS